MARPPTPLKEWLRPHSESLLRTREKASWRCLLVGGAIVWVSSGFLPMGGMTNQNLIDGGPGYTGAAENNVFFCGVSCSGSNSGSGPFRRNLFVARALVILNAWIVSENRGPRRMSGFTEVFFAPTQPFPPSKRRATYLSTRRNKPFFQVGLSLDLSENIRLESVSVKLP